MAHITLRPFNFNTHLLSPITGSGTQKALKAPCRSLVMDVGQARWDLRTRILLGQLRHASYCIFERLPVLPPVPTSSVNRSHLPSSSATG